MGCILAAASCNQWWTDTILGTKNYAEEQSGLEKELGKNEVFFLPYLMGERSPHNDVNARGAFIGMRPHTTRKEMTLAVLEGVAFAPPFPHTDIFTLPPPQDTGTDVRRPVLQNRTDRRCFLPQSAHPV